MAHYYDEEQIKPLVATKIPIRARKLKVDLWTGPGVFSKKSLDNGTKLLLNTCVIEKGWHVHDLGCGIGVAGVIVKLAEPSCAVVCSDVSKRAVKLTRMNVKDLGLDITVKQSDAYSKIPEKFDTVLLNPPYVAGRKVVFYLLEQAKAHLNANGLLQVVARHNKGGAQIMKKMEELFGNCDDSRKGSGFRVYLSKLTDSQ